MNEFSIVHGTLKKYFTSGCVVKEQFLFEYQQNWNFVWDRKDSPIVCILFEAICNLSMSNSNKKKMIRKLSCGCGSFVSFSL